MAAADLAPLPIAPLVLVVLADLVFSLGHLDGLRLPERERVDRAGGPAPAGDAMAVASALRIACDLNRYGTAVALPFVGLFLRAHEFSFRSLPRHRPRSISRRKRETGVPGARGVYAASRSERSASPAEEYPGSPLAADAPTRRSMGDPGIVTRLIPASPRPFSLPEAATSAERQPISMTRQPRRSTVTPVAPPVIAELSNSLQLLRAGTSSSPSTSTSIRPPAVREQTEALPHGSEAAEPTNGGSRFSRPVSELPIGASPLSSLSRTCRLVVGRKRGTEKPQAAVVQGYSDPGKRRVETHGERVSRRPPARSP